MLRIYRLCKPYKHGSGVRVSMMILLLLHLRAASSDQIKLSSGKQRRERTNHFLIFDNNRRSIIFIIHFAQDWHMYHNMEP